MNKEIFNNIYENKIWCSTKETPLSGTGSTLRNTKKIRNLLDVFIKERGITSITDMGCGDLNWISKTDFFNNPDIKYTGVDVADSVIASNLARGGGSSTHL